MPDSKSATASSGSSTRPSSAAPPISAPRSGPEARSQAIGGPACRNWPRLQAEQLGRRRDVDQRGLDAEHRGERLRVGVAAQRVGGARWPGRPRCRASAGASRPRVTSTAWAATASANRSAPTLTTVVGRWSSGASEQLDRAAGGRGVGQVDLGAGVGERAHLAARPCGSAAVPTTATTTGWSRPRRSPGRAAAAGSGSAPWPSTTSSRITPVRGSAAARARCVEPQRRVDHRVRPARGAGRRRRSRPSCARRWRARRPGRRRGELGVSGMLLRIGPSSSVAISIASSHSVPPTNRPRSSRPPASGSAAPGTGQVGYVAAEAAQHRLGGGGQVGLAAARAARTRPGCPAPRRTPGSRRRPRRPAAWRPPRSARPRGPRRAGAAPRGWRAPRTSADRSRPPTPSAEPTPTPAWSSRREQLLAAGAGRGDDADRAGAGGVGEAEPEAADDRGAAVGAHHQQAALGGGPLERDLLLERARCR